MQHRCARNAHDCADDAQLELDDATLDATLRELYAAHTEEHPCELSIAELAARYSPGPHGERAVRRSNGRIQKTYRGRFVQKARSYRRITLTTARWIVPFDQDPGGGGRSDVSNSEFVDLRIGDLDLEANADRAHAHAPRATRPPERERRRATRLHVPRTPLLEHPVGIEAGVIAEVGRVHGAKWLSRLVRELHKPKCHEHPAECVSALRTLAVRETENPLRLFRFLLNEAIGGDALLDTADVDKLTDEAEARARARYAWDPANPATHWPDLIPEGTAAPPPEELEPDPDELARIAARKRLEHEVDEKRRRREAERVVGLLLRATGRAPPTAAERFLKVMSGRGLAL